MDRGRQGSPADEALAVSKLCIGPGWFADPDPPRIE
jgi:hypothetical protein